MLKFRKRHRRVLRALLTEPDRWWEVGKLGRSVSPSISRASAWAALVDLPEGTVEWRIEGRMRYVVQPRRSCKLTEDGIEFARSVVGDE